MLKLKYPHPRDEFISVEELTHVYTYRNGDDTYVFKRSVSTIASFFFEKFKPLATSKIGVPKWFENTLHKNHNIVSYMLNKFKQEDDGGEERCNYIAACVMRYIWKIIAVRQSSLGINMHLAIENILNGKEVNNVVMVPPPPPPPHNCEAVVESIITNDFGLSVSDAQSICNFIQRVSKEKDNDDIILLPQVPLSDKIKVFESTVTDIASFEKWRKYRSDFIPIRVEWSIYSLKHGIAGQIDALFKRKSDGKFVMVDWKRVKCCLSDEKIFKYGNHPFEDIPDTKLGKYTIQLNVYAFILRKFYGIDVGDNMIIVQITPNDDFIEHTVSKIADDNIEIALLIVNF